MITKDNVEDLLNLLRFEHDGAVYSKYFDQYDAYLKVDLKNKQLIYPEEKGLKINERQTCNFTDNENFVVFECVHRLLEKGYKPEHIELEPKWKVGHGASGGRADVLVKDNSAKSLLIIECKTAGKELKDAWNVTQQNGGQLFSYVQQQRSTQFVCLYASNIEGGLIAYQNYIVALKDNQKLLDEYEGKQLLAFRDAQEVETIYKVWKETYKLDFATKGIFEDDIQPYHIGKQKFTVSDLASISHHDIQGKYHEFATILRQHNVSGRENAFDKLVNLFLCKLVDETKNPNDLKFYWKGIAYDSFFDLQDRLQQLYQAGMQESLKEDVTYIDNAAIDNAFRFFRNDPDATKDTIKKYFRQLKFFTNNDFAFIDVHNEKLFYQNAEVLLKIVRMLQDIRLQSDEQNQFLGDMFEGFLDQGVKQSEGQFFTPTPIVKFIMSALPLERLVQDSKQPPRAIDYACGSGHFLNELALQLKPFVETHKKADPKDYYKAIQGVEKEYRLSKVAKVSAAMYGQNEISIVYADALARHEQVKDGSYSILVANPPYSVKGFLETLPDADRQLYKLYDSIDTKTLARNNAIETFFIERAKQLLQPEGVAAIIVPSSILSNAKGGYTATREILLQYFDVVAIAQLGSRTFGKTGTNTVTLFLRRKAENPAPAEHFRNRVNAWFRGNDDKGAVFTDEQYIRDYCAHIDVAFNDYQSLLLGEPNADLLTHELFVDYQRDFEGRTETKNFRKQRDFRALDSDAQRVAINARFLTYLRRIEKNKLYHYVLASENPQPVVIIKSPTDNQAQKEFLGYDWSGAKGNEGIKYLTSKAERGPAKAKSDDETVVDEDEEKRVIENLNNLQRIDTPLYDPQRLNNPEKLNTIIRQNFLEQSLTISETLQPFVTTARLVDMLDFSRVDFDKQFSLTPKASVGFDTVWESVKVGAFVSTIESGSRPQGGVGNIKSGALSLGGEHIHNSDGTIDLSTPKYVPNEFFDSASKGILQENDILLCKDGALTGKVGILKKETAGQKAMVNEHVFILRCNDPVEQKYFFNMLFSKDGQRLLKHNVTGSAQGGLNVSNLVNIKIPFPSTDVQAHIVAECEAVDAEAAAARQAIGQVKHRIEESVGAIYDGGFDLREIGRISLDVQYGISEAMNTDGQGYKIFRMNEIINRKMADNGNMKAANISADEFAKYRLNKGDLLFNRTNSIEHVGKTGVFLLDGDYCFASYLIRVVIDTEIAIPNFVNLMMNSRSFQEEAKSKAARSINQANINATVMKNIKIPVPPLEKQAELVVAVELLEAQITAAQVVLDGAAARKQEIIRRYLTDQTLAQSQQAQ